MTPLQENTVILQSNLDGQPGWLRFAGPVDVVTATRPADVPACLERAEAYTREGYYAAGFVAYEAAGGFDPALQTHAPAGGLPVVWFGIYREPESLPAPAGDNRQAFDISEWTPDLSEPVYTATIDTIHGHIRAGDTYQVNYTFPMRASFSGDPWAFFVSLLSAQRADYCAYLDLGDLKICSLSPELFLSVEGRRVTSKPMKGTVGRGLNRAEDRAQAAALARSTKDRAENVMIVDMIRNDLGRVAETGSVRVDRLFEIERYPTVFQMTSTVSIRTAVPLSRLIANVFPCASITGAPKAKTMELIRGLETAPRGVYTGAIGYMAPGRRAQFNVAIRTALIDTRAGTAEYRVGGGIVWDSRPEQEYAECLAKAAVLNRCWPDFELLESLRWTPQAGYWLLDKHLRRLAESAEYFGFEVSIESIERRLQAYAAGLDGPHKVRLTVDRRGAATLDSVPLKPLTGMTVGLAPQACDTRTPFHCNKTTYRAVYSDAAPAGCDDAILWNADGAVTESGFANIVLAAGRRLCTPPARRGLLPGVLREHLLERGVIEEADIGVDDLTGSGRLYLLNSVRGWMALEPAAGRVHTWRLRELAGAGADYPDELARAVE